ncbi:MAG: DUF4058 family protein [Leptolyngbya sp. SIO4C5]|nr:DUF4058 family protein [Leptolyngbya sp. SIO4C5]
MPSPFPGMNPYLEHPDFWSEVHSRLIVAIADAIALPLRPHYYVAVEKRTYTAEADDSVLVGIPDVSVFSKPDSRPAETTPTATLPAASPLTVTLPAAAEIQERYLEIREVKTGAVITVLELLSPKNKRPGAGRDAYLSKRHQILASLTHLVEIDLLRAGKPMPIQGSPSASDFRILISRSDDRPQADLYAFSLRESIPIFPLPLKSGDSEPLLNLNDCLNGVYERAGFDLRIDYSQAIQPALSAGDEAWVNDLRQNISFG